MFDVSDEYIEKIKEPSRRTEINGILALKNGQVINFSSTDLMDGSVSYSNKCLNNTTFNIGSCYIGEIKLTLKTPVDRYSLIGATIVLQYLVYISDSEYENIPIGIFTIDSASRVGKYVELIAYDEMDLIEKEFNEGTAGSVKDIFDWICLKCDVSSGMTDDLWNTLINTDLMVSFSNGTYTSYRDLLGDVAVLLGGFATIDRYGCLVVRSFNNDSVDYIPDDVRKSSKFEDYKYKVKGVSLKTDKGIFSKTLSTDGAIIQLPDSKLLRASDEDEIKSTIQNILDKLSIFEYIPCKIDMLVNPAFDLGDMITSVGYNTGDEDIKSIITSINWTFRGSMNIESIGENIRLSTAKSYAEKLAIEAGTSVQETELKTIFFENASQITIGAATRTKLFDLNFTTISNDESVPMLHCQMNLNAVKGRYKIIYIFNDEESIFTPTEDVFNDGTKIITFFKGFNDATQDRVNRISVYIETSALVISEKELQKSGDIYQLVDVPHTYSGGGTINVGDINAILQSTNLSFAEEWDGRFEIEDVVNIVDKFKISSYNDFAENVEIKFFERMLKNIIDEIGVYTKTSTKTSVLNGNARIILNYDVFPYYDLLYDVLENGTTISTALSKNQLTYAPDDEDVVYTSKGFYMQLVSGEKVRLTIDTSNIPIYILSALSTEGYTISASSTTGTLDYTSDGNRFWILCFGRSRSDERTFNITATKL